jgi:hypothetical protein
MQRISNFARSPQGRRLMNQAQRKARDPKTKRQIEQVRQRFARRR